MHRTVAPRQPTLQGRRGGTERAPPSLAAALPSSTSRTSLPGEWPEPEEVAAAEDVPVKPSGSMACPVASAAEDATCSTVA